MNLVNLLTMIDKPEAKKLPTYKKVVEMNSPIVLQGEYCGITVTVYQSGYITCVDEDNNATVFTENVKLTDDDIKTTEICLADMTDVEDALVVLSSLGCSRIEHNKSVRLQRKEKKVAYEDRKLDMSTWDIYSHEREHEEASVKEVKLNWDEIMETLTDKQREVAELLIKGYKKVEIAEILGIENSSIHDRINGIKIKIKKKFDSPIYMGYGGWCRIK